MRILIDMQGLQTPFSAGRGVGAYTAGLVKELHDLNRGHELIYLFNAEFPEGYFRTLARLDGIVTRQNSRIFAQKILANYRFSSEQQTMLAEELYRAFVETIAPDVLFTPNLQEGLDDPAVTTFAGSTGSFIQIATLHDLVPLHLQAEYLTDQQTNNWYRRKIRDAINCDTIITVSESSRRDIVDLLSVPRSMVEVVPNGYDRAIYNDSVRPSELDEVRQYLGRKDPYILYYGGSDIHKNLARFIRAYGALPKELKSNFSLVLAGRDAAASSPVQRVIVEKTLQSRVLLPGFVPDDLLPALVRQATLFVFPSTHEGFGLPALEAMASGTPTIGSRAASVAEIIGRSDATFDPHDESSIVRVMTKALRSDEWRSELRDHGLARASEFSWRKSAGRLLEIMEERHAARLEGGALSFISSRLARLNCNDMPLLERAARSIAETVPPPRERKVYVDASSVAVHGGNSGIQRVVRAVATHLQGAINPGDVEVQVVYCPEEATDFRVLTAFAEDGSFTKDAGADHWIDFRAGDILVFVDLQPSLAIRMESQVQRLRALGVTVYYVVYDLLPVLMPTRFWPELQNEFYRWLQAVSQSDGLICISRTVAHQAADYLLNFGVKRPGALYIDSFHLGSNISAAVSSRGLPSDAALVEEQLGSDLKFLMVGTLEPRKGHEQTLLAFEQAWDRGEQWRLIIVGKQGWKMNRLAWTVRHHREFGRRLFWFEDASDQWLERLYELSDCVICASQGEGFGLPLIEAANHGKPVVARDIAVFREVARNGAFYFPDDLAPTAVVDALTEWVCLYQKGMHPDSKEMEPLSWDQSARQLAQLLQKKPWSIQVSPRGAVDLTHLIDDANPAVLKRGFYTQEPNFAWATAVGTIQFETVDDYAAIRFMLDCFSWRRMPFEVVLDGLVVYSGVAETSPKSFDFEVDRIAVGKHTIELRSMAVGTPVGDDRVLGIALKRLKLVAVPSVTLGEWVNARDVQAHWRGFSTVEFDWRWTIARQAEIEFRAEEAAAADLVIFGHAARHMDVVFYFNGSEAHRQTVGTDSEYISFTVPHVLTGSNVIKIEIPDVRPFSSRDDRLLGLAVLDFKLTERQPRAAEASNQEDRTDKRRRVEADEAC